MGTDWILHRARRCALLLANGAGVMWQKCAGMSAWLIGGVMNKGVGYWLAVLACVVFILMVNAFAVWGLAEFVLRWVEAGATVDYTKYIFFLAGMVYIRLLKAFSGMSKRELDIAEGQ